MIESEVFVTFNDLFKLRVATVDLPDWAIATAP
jgi:hypothetical protein